MAAGVVTQKARAGKATTEVEVEEAVALAGGGEAVKLDDGLAVFVAV